MTNIIRGFGSALCRPGTRTKEEEEKQAAAGEQQEVKVPRVPHQTCKEHRTLVRTKPSDPFGLERRSPFSRPRSFLSNDVCLCCVRVYPELKEPSWKF